MCSIKATRGWLSSNLDDWENLGKSTNDEQFTFLIVEVKTETIVGAGVEG